MKRALILIAGGLLCAAAIPAFAADSGAYRAPHNSLGQPDLGGTWTNASLTPQARSPLYGMRAVQSADEVKALEGAASDKATAGDAKSDLSKPIAESDNVGAYNQGWIDGGSRVMRVHGEARTSLLTTPDGQPPVRKGQSPRVLPADSGSVEAGKRAVKAAAAVDQLAAQGNTTGQAAALRGGQFDNPEVRALGERCILSFGRNGGPPMFSNGWYNNNYQFVQSRDAVVIDIEMVHDTRIIHLNAKHRTDGVRPWFGDSIGHYEGNTLVVETTNIPQVQNYNGSWKDLKVTEKFTRVAKDRLYYQFTVEDPTIWDNPGGGEYEFGTTNGRIQEYACHEGNYALEGMLAGAREEERLNAEAASKKPVAAK
jgi:hypothetical protein